MVEFPRRRKVYGTNTPLKTTSPAIRIFCFLESLPYQPVTMNGIIHRNAERQLETAFMTVSKFNRFSVALALSVSFCLTATKTAGAAAQTAAPPASSVQNANSAGETAAPVVSLTSQALNQKGQNYKMSPDDSTWREFLETLRIYLTDVHTLKAPSAAVIAQNKALKDMQARVLDAGGARVWTFPGSQHNHSLVIQSAGAASPEGTSGARVSIVAVPETANVTAAKIIKSSTTTTKAVKVGRRMVQKTVKVEGPSVLCVAGLDRVTGLVYLGAFKPVAGAWVATSEPFAQIPSHFMQSLSGQASFSGNDLVLSVSSQSSAPPSESAAGNTLPRPKSTSYQIVLKYNGGHFQLAGSPGKDVPLSVVTYFVQCLRTNRMDLAKAWVADPLLINNTKYTGLVGKNGEPYKLVSMTQPPNAYARYRLVTGTKYDLIFDVGKVKKDILIKSIFIAPPDSLARNLAGTIIGAPVTPPPTDASGAAPGGTTPAATPKVEH